MQVGDVVAVVRARDGLVMATVKVDLVSDHVGIRTETPYDQRIDQGEWCRRFWRRTEPHQESRVPRGRKDREVYVVRHATPEDVATAELRVQARHCVERMPRQERERSDAEARVASAASALDVERRSLDRVEVRIAEDRATVARAEAMGLL